METTVTVSLRHAREVFEIFYNGPWSDYAEAVGTDVYAFTDEQMAGEFVYELIEGYKIPSTEIDLTNE